MQIKTTTWTKIFYEGYRKGWIRHLRHRPMSGVEIDIESLRVFDDSDEFVVMSRPVAARGVVLPIDPSNKPAGKLPRGAVPDPLAYESLGLFVDSSRPGEVIRRVAPFHNRGHIFALGLGGPNVGCNIIPQWDNFQGSGDWNKLETEIMNDAFLKLDKKSPGSSLFLEIEIEYLNLKLRHLQHKFLDIFNFREVEDFTVDRVTDALRLFGSPVRYAYYTCPCSAFLQKPKNRFLSIAYVKALYEVSRKLYQNQSILGPYPNLNEAKRLLADWDIAEVSALDLLPGSDEILTGDNTSLIKKGSFVLPPAVDLGEFGDGV